MADVRPFAIRRGDTRLGVVEAATARAALTAYAGSAGLTGTEQGRSALAVLGIGLLRAEPLCAGCTCGPRSYADVYWDADNVARCRACRQPVEGPPREPVLSDLQRATLAFLCLVGRSGATAIRRHSGAGANTLVSLVGLGLLVKRAAGGRDAMYHLTETGRLLICTDRSEETTAPSASPRNGRTRPTTHSKRRTTMSTTATENPSTTDAPPVEDVTGKANESTDVKALEKALLVELRKAVTGKVTVTEKKAYRRIDKGDVRLGSVRSLKKGILVRIPSGGGYEGVKVESEKEIPKAVKALAKRAESKKAAEPAAAAQS